MKSRFSAAFNAPRQSTSVASGLVYRHILLAVFLLAVWWLGTLKVAAQGNPAASNTVVSSTGIAPFRLSVGM